jgi:hypothetical protein
MNCSISGSTITARVIDDVGVRLSNEMTACDEAKFARCLHVACMFGESHHGGDRLISC